MLNGIKWLLQGERGLKKKIVIALFFALLFMVALLVYLGQREIKQEEVYYSGIIEARQAELGFLLGGRVSKVLVDEGHSVTPGQILAMLEDSEYRAGYERAKAALRSAGENLEMASKELEVLESILPTEVERARARVNVLKAQLKELEAGYREQEIERAKLALMRSKEVLEKAGKDRDRYRQLFKKGAVPEEKWDQASLGYEEALKSFESAKQTLDMLKEGARKEAIDTARARLAEGMVSLKQAKRNLKRTETAKKKVEVLRAQVEGARAEKEVARIRLENTLLHAPFEGTVTTRNIEPGEVVTTGREVMTVSDLSRVELKIFVGEKEIGMVSPGQEVEVRADTFPQKIYKGRVSYISSEAEFTPKMIQTHKERVKLVYLVKVSIPNTHLELKPGMPADAWLR